MVQGQVAQAHGLHLDFPKSILGMSDVCWKGKGLEFLEVGKKGDIDFIQPQTKVLPMKPENDDFILRNLLFQALIVTVHVKLQGCR